MNYLSSSAITYSQSPQCRRGRPSIHGHDVKLGRGVCGVIVESGEGQLEDWVEELYGRRNRQNTIIPQACGSSKLVVLP